MTCAWNCTSFAPDDRDCARYGLGAMAMRYAWMGYAVLPLARGGKRPHQMLGGSGGVHRASKDATQIAEWWSLDMAANIGVACGSVSRLAVIDLDVKHGADGGRSFWEFQKQYGVGIPAPGAPVAATPSGGCHLWLRTPDGAVVPERPGVLPGVDVKGDGGYVVAAPSMLPVVPLDRSGGTTGEIFTPYEWVSGCPHEAPDAPGWLLPWLASAVSQGSSQANGAATGSPTVPDEEAGLPVGSRNRDMYRIACSLYRKLGTDPASAGEVRERLRAVWDKTDKSGFGWSEVLTCAESARRFIERQSELEAKRNKAFLAWLYGRD